jgi:hypothetical protein
VVRIFIVGPTSRPFDDAAGEVAADLAHLARPGVVVEHRTTGGGPARVRSDRDALEAAPRVVRSMIEDWRDGAGVVVVDCTADPGADIAAAAVGIPVVGAGAALRAAFTSTYEAQAALPPAHWEELAQRGRRARIVRRSWPSWNPGQRRPATGTGPRTGTQQPEPTCPR